MCIPIPPGIPHWLIALAIVVFLVYRYISVRKLGEAVGRAKAKVKASRMGLPAAAPKIETGLNRDFAALDLKPGASFDQVKSAYRELAKVWHPDRFGDDAKLKDRANVKLGEINAAYERLKNHFEQR